MVRRQAATNLAKFVKTMPTDVVVSETIPLFEHLAGDDQDSVRLLTVEVLIAIAESVPLDKAQAHGQLLQSLRNLFTDKSWRVRYMVADRFEKASRRIRGARARMLMEKADCKGCWSRRCQEGACTSLCEVP